ncbi:hypothetical protein QW180_23835 [Vibrio sinaloensis]|nr:hypothetical protein [Vibrio sinaloensis]
MPPFFPYSESGNTKSMDMMSYQSNQPDNKTLRSEWLLWAIPAYIALLIWMSLHYLLSVDNDKQYALHNERVIVDLIDEVLGETLIRMSADAKKLNLRHRKNHRPRATTLSCA